MKYLRILNTLVGIIFAPSFLLFIHYFEFLTVVKYYLVALFLYLLVAILLKKRAKDLLVPLLYCILMLFAYFFNSFASLKMIPALLSGFFFILFLDAFMKKRFLVLFFVKKFYKKPLSIAKEHFIAHSDGYWMGVTFVNVVIQLFFVFTHHDYLWAFYSSVGWYIFFAVALVLQILYEKLFFNFVEEQL